MSSHNPRSIVREDLTGAMVKGLVSAICSSYLSAHREVSKRWRKRTGDDMFPYYRRANIEDALHDFADAFSEWKAFFEPNVGRNCSHVELRADRLWITAAAVQHNNEVVRPARYRSCLALPNGQFELFSEHNEIPKDVSRSAYGVLLHASDPRRRQVPAFIKLGFPHPEEQRYIAVIDLPEVYGIPIKGFYPSGENYEKVVENLPPLKSPPAKASGTEG